MTLVYQEEGRRCEYADAKIIIRVFDPYFDFFRCLHESSIFFFIETMHLI